MKLLTSFLLGAAVGVTAGFWWAASITARAVKATLDARRVWP